MAPEASTLRDIRDREHQWWILAAMGGVLGLVVLDETVLGVALPTLRTDLGMTAVASHWVINAYLLVFASFLAAAGRLGDHIGLRNLFLLGAATFGLASLAAASARDGAWLIAARAVQGLGAAAVFPTSVALIAAVFEPRQRGLAFGIHTAVGGVFMSLGPLVGGFFCEKFSWRWIFWINLPVVAAISLVLLATGLSPPRKPGAPRLDVPGLVMLVAGVGGLVLALMQGPVWGWSAPVTLGTFAGGAAAIVIFALLELRAPEPLLDLALLGNPTIAGSNLAVGAGQFTKIAVIVFGALYLQDAAHLSPLQAGEALLVAVVPTGISALIVARLADRISPRPLLLAALLLAGAALLWMGLAAGSKRYGPLIPALVLWGIALPYHYVPARRAVANAVALDKQAQANGVNMTFQFLGGTVGMAASGALLVGTGSFRLVFLMNAAVSFAAMVGAWLLIRGSSDEAEAPRE